MNDKATILSLRAALHRHNRLYYVDNAPEISDQEFDRMMRQLQDLEALHPEMHDDNSPTQRVGSDLSGEFQTVRHERPMLSLGNTYSREEVAEFYGRVAEGLAGEPFEICCELKFDGLSISLHYEDGRLVRAVTRGDGTQGDDVTANVRTISSIPLVLPEPEDLFTPHWPHKFEIRGEVLMPWTSFERLNAERAAAEEPLFANPRNAASGTLKNRNPSVVAKRGLDAYLYYLLPAATPDHYSSLQTASQWGFKVSQAMRTCSTLEEIYSFIDYWDSERKNLPVATDGIVLKVNSMAQQQKLGYTAKSPRWAIAYKYQAESACTRLREVTFQVGRTGAVTPVANMDAVQLSGTTVRRATLHNADFMEALDLHIGDMVYVEKGGEIIPKITAVDLDARDGSTGPKVRFIDHCPECGAPLVRYEGEAAWYCTGQACPPQIKGRIEHFISRRAMNIDSLGPETVDEYWRRGLVHDFADLYDISILDINGAGGEREKSARKIVEGIRASCSVPFERVVFAIGIRFVGETTAKILARRFKNMDALAAATTDELLQLSGIGQTIAESVTAYFRDSHNLELIERLRRAGVTMTLSEEQLSAQSDALAGQGIVISGVFANHSRDEYKQMVEQHGGRIVSSISAKTSFVLAGQNMGPAKLEKAQKLGIRIMGEDEFLEKYGSMD